MRLLVIILCFNTVSNVISYKRDCVEGEIWYEICKKCKCQKNNFYSCELHLPSCNLAKCIMNIVIFDRKMRCHCSKNGSTICVPLSYQPGLDGKPCTGESYYYDNCTFCQCDSSFNTTRCTSNYGCRLSRGGSCRDGIMVMENCYRCHCTLSKFRMCSPVNECILGKEKPGKCRFIEDYFSPHLKEYCIDVRNQECYSDYACPGRKKCCQIVDCFLRCVDPV